MPINLAYKYIALYAVDMVQSYLIYIFPRAYRVPIGHATPSLHSRSSKINKFMNLFLDIVSSLSKALFIENDLNLFI